MKIVFIAAVTAALLSGCAAQQLQQRQAEMAKEAKDATEKCEAKYNSDSRLDAIRAKIPLSIEKATLTQRANPERATEAEKRAIEALDELAVSCATQAIDIASRYLSPQQVALFSKVFADGRASRAELWAGRITYGAYLTQGATALVKAREDEAAIVANLNQQAASQRAQEAQASAAGQAAFAQTLQGLAIMNKATMPRAPINTTCSQLGNFVNCQTR